MLSTRNLTPEDLAAVTTYLLGDSPPPPAPLPAVDAGADTAAAGGAGRTSYVALCAGCHGLEGDGLPNTVVALRANSTLRLCRSAQPDRGDAGRHRPGEFPHRASLQAMPGFADKLSDEQAAALANYLRPPGRPEAGRDARRGARAALSTRRRVAGVHARSSFRRLGGNEILDDIAHGGRHPLLRTIL